MQAKMAQDSRITGSDIKKCSLITLSRIPRIRWTVEDVSKRPWNLPGTPSPEFYFTPEFKCLLYLLKHANGYFVYICNQSDAAVQIERTIVLYDANYIKIHDERDARILSLEKNHKVYLTGALSKERFQYLTNDMLIIDLCVSIQADAVNKLDSLLHDIDAERKLREDLKTMLENPINSDLSLQVGNERIPAHWSVLCARSPYFKRMFDSGMQESVQNSITVTDSSLGTIKKLIQFLYTADFIQEDDLQELFDLYYAADKYEVQDLKRLCACNIMENATAYNTCQILQLAHRHNDETLRMEAMDFILLYSGAVFQTEGWKKFKASEPLAAEVCSFFCLKK